MLILSEPGVELRGQVRIEKGCLFELGRGATLRIHDCHIGHNVRISILAGASIVIEGFQIGPYCYLVSRDSIFVGPGTGLGEMTIVRDANHDPAFPLRDMKFVASPVHIGENVWVGARTTILSGVTIGDNSTIGAGAVVTSDVGPSQTVGGIPARPILPKPDPNA